VKDAQDEDAFFLWPGLVQDCVPVGIDPPWPARVVIWALTKEQGMGCCATHSFDQASGD
jgi:hypothetical protein